MLNFFIVLLQFIEQFCIYFKNCNKYFRILQFLKNVVLVCISHVFIKIYICMVIAQNKLQMDQTKTVMTWFEYWTEVIYKR